MNPLSKARVFADFSITLRLIALVSPTCVILACGTETDGGSDAANADGSGDDSPPTAEEGNSGAPAVGSAAGPLEEEPAEPAAPIPIDQFVDRYVATVCEQKERCCISEAVSLDWAVCEELTKFDVEGAVSLVRRGASTYDEVLAGECLARIAMDSRCGVSLFQCSQAVEGTIALGGECVSTLQCQKSTTGSRRCEFDRCVQRSPAGLGDPCSVSCFAHGLCFEVGTPPDDVFVHGVCDQRDGLRCSPEMVCEPTLEIGADCELGTDCEVGTVCSPSNADTCQLPKADGEPCVSDECAEGLRCFEGRCSPRVPLGGACVTTLDCASDECMQGVCVPKLPSFCR